MNRNTVLISGAIGLVAGIVLKVIGVSFFGYILIGLSVLWILIGIISLSLINASKAEVDNTADNLEVRINGALTKVRQDKFKAEGDIRRIKSWAADAIIETFAEFYNPGALAVQKDTLVEKYVEIKTAHGQKLSYEQSEKIDRIVAGYQNQIAMRLSQIEVLEKLMEEYTQTKKKFDATKAKGKKMERLDKHTQRLETMDDNSNALSDTMTESYRLEDINKEFALKEAYITQLEQLQSQYGDDSNFNNSVAFKGELDKMLVGMKPGSK